MTEGTEPYRPERYRRVFVAEQDRLPGVVDELRRADALGVDLEMVQRVRRLPGGLQEWRQVLALIQLASESLSVVVDPVRVKDLSALRPIMRGTARKVFLGGGQDAVLLEQAGIGARNVADVGEIALALFGRRQDGMAALAQRIYGISLDKTVRRADWLARPLNPVLLSYAHQDAELTLEIYRWFQRHYPVEVKLHERPELEPGLPEGTPDWLRVAAERSVPDPTAAVMGAGFDPEADEKVLADELRNVLQRVYAPRQINRLLRLAGDLGLRSLLPEVLTYVDSPSSLIRASAARSVGMLADAETGEPVLQRLRQDPILEVQKSAEAAMRDLKRAPSGAEPAAEATTESALDEDARAALQRLMDQLQGESSPPA